MKISVYHNSRCRKSRAGLEYVKTKTDEIEIVDYLSNGIKLKELKDLLMKLNMKAGDLVRTQEDIYKQQFKGKKFSDDEWASLICEHPKLLKRPIVIKGYKAVVGDPVENIETLFR